MSTIFSLFQARLTIFKPFLTIKVHLNSPYFKQRQGNVADFLQEIEANIQQFSQQSEAVYQEYFAERIVVQVDLLKQAVDKAVKNAKQPQQFRSHYRFPRNVHSLPPEKRLKEYKKALRILNEKLAWLAEQAYLNEAQRDFYVGKIQETEYRKMKCLKAIDELESGRS